MPAILEALARSGLAHRETIPERHKLFKVGQPAGAMYVVKHGYLKVYEGEIFSRFAGSGSIAGTEVFIPDQEFHTSSAVAIEATEVYRVYRGDIDSLRKNGSNIAFILLAEQSRIIRDLGKRHSALRDHTHSEQLAYLLIDFAHYFGEDESGKRKIPGLNQQEYADLLGSNRERINRTLKEWEKEGIIRVRNQVIEVLNCDPLMMKAGIPTW